MSGNGAGNDGGTGARGEGLSHGPLFEPVRAERMVLPYPVFLAEPREVEPEEPHPDEMISIPAFAPQQDAALVRQIALAFGGGEAAWRASLNGAYAPVRAPIMDEPLTRMNEAKRRRLGLFEDDEGMG